MPRRSNWVEREKRPLSSLREELLPEECYLDRAGQEHCQHEHEQSTLAPTDFADVYREMPGWTAQL